MTDVLEYRSAICPSHRVFHDVVKVESRLGPITTVVTTTGLELAIDNREGVVWAVAGGNQNRTDEPSPNTLTGRHVYEVARRCGTHAKLTADRRRAPPPERETTWDRMQQGGRR